MIPEIDIWRAATLMLKRYGENALEQSRTRIDELAADGDHDGADTWRRITAAIEQLANTIGPVHSSDTRDRLQAAQLPAEGLAGIV